jgi:signal transduction histidine kinase
MTRHDERPTLSEHDNLAALRAELGRERRNNELLQQKLDQVTRSVDDLRTFARDISHDLKLPLAGIFGYAQLLEHLDVGSPPPPGYDEFVSEINRAADRMRRLIDDALTYSLSGKSELHLGPIELSVLVDDLSAEMAGRVRPAPQISREPLPVVLGDHSLVRRVMENLIGNSIKYVRAGETARVHVGARVLDDGTVRIEVTDRGIGIQDGHHEMVFRELHRVHPEAYPGSGLGLPICRRILHRLGGVIGADPHFRGGTMIWFTLPRAVAADSPAVVAPRIDRDHTAA